MAHCDIRWLTLVYEQRLGEGAYHDLRGEDRREEGSSDLRGDDYLGSARSW